MTTRSEIPFNIKLLELTPAKLVALKPIRSQDIFISGGTNYNEDGLFSPSIFGKSGSAERQTRFSYIDVKVPIFHPVIFRSLTSLKRLYGGILAGTEYVLWNDKICDFEKSDVLNGKTGYDYFVKYWKEIKYEQNKSIAREQNILLVKNYAEHGAQTDKILVMPAGLRDIEVGDDGRVREDEINEIYRRLLSVSNTISDSAVKSTPEVINTARMTLQVSFNLLYETIENMIEGKKKLLMGKWATRAVMNGTRNVITAMDTSVSYLGAEGTIKANNTVVGLYQGMKAILPVAQYLIRNGFLAKVFRTVDTPTTLVNKKTLKSEQVMLKPAYFQRWMTDEGIEKVITSFSEEGLRDKVLEIEGYYVGLIYKGPDGTFRFMQDIDELPPSRFREHVYPITFCELLYLSGYTNWNRYPIFVTRYPIAGVGSIYPSKMYVRTTIKSETRKELNEAWEPMADRFTAYEFPIAGPYINSLMPHSAHLKALVADFDGDMCSGNGVYADESIGETDLLLSKKMAYVGTDNKFTYSTSVDTVELVFHNMTGD